MCWFVLSSFTLVITSALGGVFSPVNSQFTVLQITYGLWFLCIPLLIFPSKNL